ncbi:hypothetical protein [Teredinibacter sp. KSP-S5-2]|uniref:hypothetical protein n=1 Tax=Teredinibacter sp. KSP-S5-2 TaxID=3034506 RepID=UPI00293486A1|nr:hypothetical protein [Teredinibacter sp. KSP-S5-2]WNO07523.1 hypothetical protein P5V12_11025 [Teredinibacter sp. KSP-S5-2]
MTYAQKLKELTEFGDHFDYDITYIRELLETSPNGYSKFEGFRPLASHRELLGREAYWVVKIAAMKSEDCGECLQLNIRMALEDGCDRMVIEEAVRTPELLSSPYKEIFEYATKVSLNETIGQPLEDYMMQVFDKGQLLELGIAVSTAKLFPTLKRSVGVAKSCQVMEFSF